MNAARQVVRLPPRYLYRLNPQNLREVQVKYNKPRARWRHHSFHGSSTLAINAQQRLSFAEYDRRE